MDRYAVIGNPVAHSKSPQIHAAFAAQTGEQISYATLLAPLDRFAETVAQFRASGGRGLNVTVPFKQQAFAAADVSSERACAAGAVNTLSFDGGKILGDTTDGIGLVRDLSANLGVSLHGRNVLLIGAGGAARGVVAPLLAEQPARLVIANRTVTRAEELALSFASLGAIEVCSFDQLGDAGFDIVINATSIGLSDAALPLSSKVFAHAALAYDMMYGKALTPFLRQAAAAGTRTADGLGMLVEQAAASFLIWRGVSPDTRPVLDTLRAILQAADA
jgi:shikimate dehydrogenase